MLNAGSFTRIFCRGMIAIAASMSLSFCASAADSGHGEIIAKRWCASCHLVAEDQKQANADVSSFPSIARKKLSDEKLAAFLIDPHPKMPDMSLSRAEIADIIAYIGSLD
jgi:mono/diheme cytochrome c family protein